MKVETTCKSCSTELIIIENQLNHPGQKTNEDAVCPICENTLLSKKIDGWYFVQTLESEKQPKVEECKYPMP
jgi:ssDNA-binding Zn-finger/Zn-ribbon topoisomerase 1